MSDKKKADQARRKQLVYRANHRGIKEMDIILGGYADAHVMAMSEAQLTGLEAIMAESDRDLLAWFTGEIPVPQALDTPLFEQIREFTLIRSRNKK